ncbi:MAG: DUF4421 family protein [Planctomycetota bacterium]
MAALLIGVAVSGRSEESFEAHSLSISESVVPINNNDRANRSRRFSFFELSDSDFIRAYERLSIRPTMAIMMTNFGISSADDADTVEYQPNIRSRVGAAVGYRGVYLSGTLQLPGSEKETDIYGKTDSTDFQFNYHLRQTGCYLYYQNYKGFYTEKGGVIETRPDIRLRGAGADLYFALNGRRFSWLAATGQSERQLKSAGSWIAMASAYYMSIDGDAPLVPAAYAADFGPIADLIDGEFFTLSGAAGYGYSYVFFDDFFISGVGLLALGVQFHSYDFSTTHRSDEDIVMSPQLLLSAGWHTDRRAVSVSFFIKNNNVPIDDATLTGMLFSAAFLYTHRFNI